MAKFQQRSRRRLGMESLEKREMMAGDVTANVSASGALTITGDAAGNGVELQDQGNGDILVVGRDQAGGPTTINGQPSFLAQEVGKDISVDLHKGSDALMNFSNLFVHGRMWVETGSGSDYVQLHHLIVDNDLMIETDEGSDYVSVQNSVMGVASSHGNLQIWTGSGNDVVVVHASECFWLTISTHTGSDRISVSDSAAYELSIDTDYRGIGDDMVSVSEVFLTRNLEIVTRGGRDAVFVRDTRAYQIYVGLGSGDDFLFIHRTTAYALSADGEEGTDQVTLADPNWLGNVELDRFEV